MSLALYAVAAAFGYVLATVLPFFKTGALENRILDLIMAGKRVIICVDDYATIYEMVDGRIRVSRALTNFMEETNDPVDGVQRTEPPQHFSELP